MPEDNINNNPFDSVSEKKMPKQPHNYCVLGNKSVVSLVLCKVDLRLKGTGFIIAARIILRNRKRPQRVHKIMPDPASLTT